MNFRRSSVQEYYLRDTLVENFFINEYMVDAEGDYVKVYLLAIMYADHDDAMSNSQIARHLNIEEEDVLKAWTYWEKVGVIKKHFLDAKDTLHYEVEFLCLKEKLYANNTSGRRSSRQIRQDGTVIPEHLRSLMMDDKTKALFRNIESITGRPLEGKEPFSVLRWLDEFNMSHDLIAYAYTYCVNHRKNNRLPYVETIINEWENEGIKTVEDAEALLAQVDSRRMQYNRVMKALGFHRNPTEAEMEKMDNWFDELGLSMETVLEACNRSSGISNPNINYINSILLSWSKEKAIGDNAAGKTGKEKDGSPGKFADQSKTGKRRSSTAGGNKPNAFALAKKELEQIKRKNEEDAKARKKEVFKKIPRIEELEGEILSLSGSISRILLSGDRDSRQQIQKQKQKIDYLSQEIAYLLTESNFSHDYMDVTYDCSLCNDTGVMESGERCQCFTDRLKKYLKEE